jgi:YidC/Oxa1 family membrane protein insertase
MDRKSIILLVLSIILMVTWPLLVNKVLYPPKPLPPGMTNAPVAEWNGTNQPGTAAPQATNPAAPGAAAATAPAFVVNTNIKESFLEATNENARYVFSSYGGGLDLVELRHYPEVVGSRLVKDLQTNRVATLNSFTPVPTLGLLGGDAVQGDGIFELKRTANGVRAEKQLTNGLGIVKVFTLSSNYLVEADIRLENRSSQPLSLPAHQWVIGTASPLSIRDDGSAVGVQWYDGAHQTDVGGGNYFSKSGFACTPRTPPPSYQGGSNNVAWAAVHNQFFALAAMPQQPAQKVMVYVLDLPRSEEEEARLAGMNVMHQQCFEAALVYPALTLAPNASLERKVYLYAGPKEYQTLVRIADRLNNNIDLLMGYGNFWGFFSKAMLLAMNTLHRSVGLPYGWAIVAITVIIKLAYWPLTQASTRSMKRMQALQPQMNALKEKYKEDQVKLQKKMMELMKENKVSPLGGCLPSLLQIPVFFGFFYMIRSAIELRGASWLWVGDLSMPDTLFVIPGLGFIPRFGIPGIGLPFNLLPLIMGATMLLQARMTPTSAGMDPAQAKMMRYLPLVFLLFLYNYSAGLTLYWTVQNVLTIIQTKLTRTDPAPAPAPVLTPSPKRRK